MIRSFVYEDMKRILELETDCFPKAPYSRSMFDYLYERDDVEIFVFERDGVVAGDVAFEKRGHAITLAVSTEHRREGIGTALMLHAARQIDGFFLYLEVRVSNDAAKGFYASIGGKRIGSVRGYYRDPPEDAELWALMPVTIR